ncbi:MAG: hypothetical protein WDZ37_05350 [Solirubrobacterales bacterium]
MKQRRDEIIDAVGAVGGIIRATRDGHLAVYDRQGRYLTKFRDGHSKGADRHGQFRGILRGVVRRIEAS